MWSVGARRLAVAGRFYLGAMSVCIERKRYLSGGEATFECELVALEPGFGILKYVLDREFLVLPARASGQVHGLALRPGHVTHAFYWTDRPYNLYWWVDERGQTLGHYFNLADSVVLSRDEFSWRDLIVDVLVLPDGQALVIDEDQVPAGLDQRLQALIQTSKCIVLRDYPAIADEATTLLARYTHASL